jgi:hypothetical protein
MIKKLLNLSVLILFAFPVLSQTIVSTTPENRKAILEEFTGVNCQWCPQGHAIANAIKNNHPDNFFVINIHQGGFATPGAGQPDFRTPFGNAIVNQSYSGGGFGYPSGTVNRQNFPGREMTAPGTTAMGRNFWTISSNEVIAQPSYVNLGVEAVIDVNTRELTVHIEAYYTGNSPVSTNKLNVVLLQNNTLGPQVGGGMGNNYPHMHRLVHMVTGQWGVDINTTTAGSFVDQTFTYTIPAAYNGVPVDFFEAELEVVVFMTETQQNIISGNGAYASYTGLPFSNDVSIKDVEELLDQCAGFLSPKIKIQNTGTNPLTSLEIEYSVNGGDTQTYSWTGNLTSLQMETIVLPEIEYDIQANNTLVISLPNDDDNSNNEATLTFGEAEHFDTNEVQLTIVFDNYPQETTWNIKNSSGAIIYSGGPYPASQAGQTFQQTLSLNSDDCYTFSIFDSYGDGICCAFGQGSYKLEDQDGTVIVQGGNFDSSEATNFSASVNLGVGDYSLSQILLYPNPSTGIINVQTKNTLDISIFDITGKQVFNASDVSNENQLDLSGLRAGLYLVKMNDGTNHSTQKLIIK